MATTIKCNGKPVYITPTGFKIGSKGKVSAPGTFYGNMPKSERRKLRKASRNGGFSSHASAPTRTA